MLTKFYSLIVIVFFALVLILPNTIFADENNCSSTYGDKCISGNLEVNKFVKNPQTGELVGSLSSNGPSFLAGQEVNFRVEVKNTGSNNLSNIKVTDKLPDLVDFVSGPGSLDKNTKILTWYVDDLNGGQSKIFDIKTKVKSSKDLPDLGIDCLTNFAKAQKDSMIGQDSSAFCIQTKILGAVTELPKTGQSTLQELLIGSLLMLAASVILIKKFKVN